MKKFLLSVFIFTGIAVYSDTCNAGFYKIEGNKVYYAYDMNPNPDLVELGKQTEVKNSGHRAVCYYYAKDKKNVYYKGQVINGADVKTFKVLENLYAEDKNSWYEYGKKINN